MTRSAKEIYKDVTAHIKAEQRAREEALVQKIEALRGEALPTLEGSEKQIAWATEIRLKKLAELEEMIEEALAEMPGETELIEAQGREYKTKLLQITRAATWIDIRKNSVEQILSTVARRNS
ncbi:hypothetical protein [Candidatus Darwinibacter acetoxidans]